MEGELTQTSRSYCNILTRIYNTFNRSCDKPLLMNGVALFNPYLDNFEAFET